MCKERTPFIITFNIRGIKQICVFKIWRANPNLHLLGTGAMRMRLSHVHTQNTQTLLHGMRKTGSASASCYKRSN